MILTTSKIAKIVNAKPRSYLLIENLTDSTVYLSNREHSESEDFTRNSIAIKLDGHLEINPCIYQGDLYAYSTTESDIRILEL